MSDDGWSRALVASTGVPVSSAKEDDEVRALAHEAAADRLELARMAELATSRHPVVREAIAARRDVTLALQAALVHDRKRGVRVALAANSALATPIARVLSKDRDPSVLKALARCDTVSLEILEALTGHRREEVAHLARKTIAARAATFVEADDAARGIALHGRAVRSAEVGELEDGARARALEAAARRRADAESPVGERIARAYAPRPAARPAGPPLSGPRPAR